MGLNRMVLAVFRRGWLATIGLGLLLDPAGCSSQDPPSPYEVFSGVVKAQDMETGELFIRPERAPASWRSDRNIPCVVTKDSEIYINDCFSSIGDIRVGDRLESVGYRDRDRFVLSLVSINRRQPEPPLPELLPATTEPTPEDSQE